MRVSEINVCSYYPHGCKSPHLTITARLSSLSPEAELHHSVFKVFYLGNARDDIGVFAGVVFLVAAEYSNLAALQNVNLWVGGKKKHNTIL